MVPVLVLLAFAQVSVLELELVQVQVQVQGRIRVQVRVPVVVLAPVSVLAMELVLCYFLDLLARRLEVNNPMALKTKRWGPIKYLCSAHCVEEMSTVREVFCKLQIRFTSYTSASTRNHKQQRRWESQLKEQTK
jgi:hypothetical protein